MTRCSQGHTDLVWYGYDPFSWGVPVAWYDCRVCRTTGMKEISKMTEEERRMVLAEYETHLRTNGMM